MRYKIWHIPQVPMKDFECEVESVADGYRILDILTDYDKFQFENNVKPDYCSAQGLMVMEDGEWVDYDPDFHEELE